MLVLGAGVLAAVDEPGAVDAVVVAEQAGRETAPVVPADAGPPVPLGNGPTTTEPPTEISPPPTAALPPAGTPPPTQAPPAPPSSSTPPSASAPAATPPPPTQAPPAPTTSRIERVEQRFLVAVPSAWRAAVPARLSIIPGSTSWAWSDGRIEVSTLHADASDSHLAVVLTHEFGHLIAFRFGTGAHAGAAPAGWPAATSNPAEHWADCVQQVFTGTISPSHGLPACGGAQLSWTRAYLAAGPPAS